MCGCWRRWCSFTAMLFAFDVAGARPLGQRYGIIAEDVADDGVEFEFTVHGAFVGFVDGGGGVVVRSLAPRLPEACVAMFVSSSVMAALSTLMTSWPRVPAGKAAAWAVQNSRTRIYVSRSRTI